MPYFLVTWTHVIFFGISSYTLSAFLCYAHQVYIIDFGLAKRYRDSTTNRHIPYRYLTFKFLLWLSLPPLPDVGCFSGSLTFVQIFNREAH